MHKYINALTDIFKNTADKREAHYKSGSVISEMSSDSTFFTAVLQKHLATPEVLNTKHYPVVGINIEQNPYYELVANCWIPLPGRETHISTKAIHHHGDMLLTTLTIFGPGYEHWKFKRPEEVDPTRERYLITIIERAPHPLSHVSFVDSYVAHLPFYPPSLTITLALWSSKNPTTWKDSLKRMPILKKNRAALRDLAARAGLARQLDLKLVDYFDFYPTDEGFKGIKDRKEFERGPNTDYLHSLFHIIQETGNEHLAPLVKQQLDAHSLLENSQLIKQLLRDLQSGRAIEGRLSAGHFNMPRANFTKQEIEHALARQQSR